MSYAEIIIIGLFGITGLGCICLLGAVWIEAVKVGKREPK